MEQENIEPGVEVPTEAETPEIPAESTESNEPAPEGTEENKSE